MTGANYKDDYKEFPDDWFDGLDMKSQVTNAEYDPQVNQYKVKAGQVRRGGRGRGEGGEREGRGRGEGGEREGRGRGEGGERERSRDRVLIFKYRA